MTSFGTEYLNFIRHSCTNNPKVRLAPTPSGYLHTGNAVNFVLNAALARLSGNGSILLRIDDLDADRKRPEFVQDVFDTLRWLDINWDEGPADPDDFEKNWSQRLRLDMYNALLQELRQRDLLFPCQKSRKDLERHPVYPAEFRDQGLSFDDPEVAWRIKTPGDFPLIDFIVRRRDGIPAYQIASIADDLHFDITHIIRGQDLADSTRAQQWIAAEIGLYKFLEIKFLHHPLITDDRGEKLSKSAGATSIKSLREAGEGPEKIFQTALQMLGLEDYTASSFEQFLACLRTL